VSKSKRQPAALKLLIDSTSKPGDPPRALTHLLVRGLPLPPGLLLLALDLLQLVVHLDNLLGLVESAGGAQW